MARYARRGHGRNRKGPTRGVAQSEPTGIIKVNRRGYAFVAAAEGDFFIPADRLCGAFDGDLVSVRVRLPGEEGRRSAAVTRVLQRNTSSVIGIYERNGGLGVVRPSDPRIRYDIFCNAGSYPIARTGDVVMLRIITYPSRHESAFGSIVEVLGRQEDPDMRMRVLIRQHGLETVFSEATVAEAGGRNLDIAAALAESDRVDLRERLVFTIDPADARDFDDAVSICRDSRGLFHLGVHIADVSSYVPWGSSIDLDARRRATSVYLADRVIPMLPPRLSDDLCSLKPHEDRLAFTVDMVVDGQGEVQEASFYPSVIRSSFRFDYDCVQGFYDARGPYPDGHVQAALETLDELASVRSERRARRGGIDFDGAEVKLVLDEAGRVTDIHLRHRTRATGAIEEAMILANECVASYLEPRCASMVYRVHQEPNKDSMVALLPLLTELGYPTEGLSQADPHAIQRVLDHAVGRPEKDLVSTRVLRSMKRAIYSPVNIGHFGLASERYCHFTSPIRRYPDLIVHRLLRAALLGVYDAQGEADVSFGGAMTLPPAVSGIVEMSTQVSWLCRHCSEMERVAQDAASASVQMKLCEYMEEAIGQEFDGIVASVSTAGLTIVLPDTIRGLVRMQFLGDEYFVYDPGHQTLVGEKSGMLYHVGQRLRVRLESVSIDDLDIVFSLA